MEEKFLPKSNQIESAFKPSNCLAGSGGERGWGTLLLKKICFGKILNSLKVRSFGEEKAMIRRDL